MACMTAEEELKAFKVIIRQAYRIDLHMSDTFSFACAEGEYMFADDVELMLPIIVRYGHDALVAYAAVKRGAEPIDCKCNHKNEQYQAAKKEIEAIKAANEFFMED